MYSMVLVAALATSPVVPDCHRGCHGCHGCYGCYGCHGCWGCYGGCYGCYGGCYGCYGGCYGYYAAPAPTKMASTGAPAQLIVQVPADAKLFLDDQLTTTSSEERTFVTPNLDSGYLYTYTVRAEISRDGQKYTETKKIGVTAGSTSRLSFTESAMIAAKNDQSVVSAGR
jgi:uncharacterized protein (TIGR03000 family)